MSGRGRGRRVVNPTGGENNALSLNDRFSQLRGKGSSPATRAARRGFMAARGGNARFSAQMEKRTGKKPNPQTINKTRRGAQGSFQTRRGGRGAATPRFRGTRGNARGGRGGARGGRGRGGKRGGKVSQQDLDADLDSYMGRSEKVASQKLDDDLDAYMAERDSSNVEEKKA